MRLSHLAELSHLDDRPRLLMTGTTDDLSLIAECRSGRTDAFGPLVQRYQDRLYPTAIRLTGGVEDALDLLQETFLRAYQKLAGFHAESSFYTWVYRIMVNLALTERRKRHHGKRRHQTSCDLLDPPDDSVASDPAGRLERLEREGLVQRALERLAPDHRVVVVMKEFDGLRYEEIAATLGIPIGTVRSRLHRARVELKEMLTSIDDSDAPHSALSPEPARIYPDDPSSSSSVILPFRGTRPPASMALTPPHHHEI
jgi:RNA polymerase sigma-70 factor (ECF subfamily)